MEQSSNLRKDLMDEIVNRKKLGDKKFHSETSLQHYGEEEPTSSSSEKDPGVLNESVSVQKNDGSGEEDRARRRTMSQPGPVSGGLLTATAARAARKRPQRNVMYADLPNDMAEKNNSQKYLTPIKIYDSETPDRNSPAFNNSYKNGDTRSMNSYRLYTSNNDIRAGTPRKRSVTTMDAQSIRSIETHAPPPTSPEYNKKLTVENLTITLSCMYAIFLVTLGLVSFIADPFTNINVTPIYCIVLITIGISYMIYLMIDIGRYKTRTIKNLRIKSRHDESIDDFFKKQEEEYNTMSPGERTPDTLRSNITIPPPLLIPLKHDYCFSQGRHSGSFYLKLGAAGFAMGHLVHSVLLIVVQIGFVADENINNDECVNIPQMVLDFLNPCYCFFQLYFIFKYSNVIIMCNQSVARFAFMHYIGTCLCFWISAIVRETVLALTLYAQSNANGYDTGDDAYGNETRTMKTTQTSPIERLFDVSGLYDENCVGPVEISTIYEDFSPYLYPFSVEFNIFIVAVYYIVWSNIGNCGKDKESDDDNTSSSLYDTNTICKIPTATDENDFSSNIVIHADCHASNRGLFLGMIVLVLVVGMLIVGFVFSSVGSPVYLEIGYLLNNCTQLFLHVCLLIASLIAFNQMTKLDINEHPVSLLDDILLFICLPAFFMETIFSMVATIDILNIVRSVDTMLMVIQVIIQTALIVDGLRRCCNTRKLRRSKPGREVIMFLIIANVGMWILNTFSYKSPESLDERYTFYGKVLWSILGHISLPLIMFYRFHSSVCFADIWSSAYQPGSEH